MCKRKLQRKFVVFRQPYDVSKTRVDRFNLIFVLLEERVFVKEGVHVLNGQRLDLPPLKGRAGEPGLLLKGHRGLQVPHRVVQPGRVGQLPQGGGDQQQALQGQLGLLVACQPRHRLPGVQLAVPGPAQHGVQLLVQDDVGRVPEVRKGVGRQHRRLGSAVGQPDALKGPAAHAVAAVQCVVAILVVVVGEDPVGVVRHVSLLWGLHQWECVAPAAPQLARLLVGAIKRIREDL
mmetsp:Transcript_12886/g.22919  ORF Transcript_12886/g.22919 Transcript_12886/m.22919 type:complete len:234 (+) Transcript_12886:574-1275(+)